MDSRSSRLEISLLGPPQVLLNGQPVEGLRRKNRALLFYLAAGKKSVPRDSLLSFFWPDYERADAQAILRTMIHDLRKHLGESFQADDQNLSLSPDVRIDAHLLLATIDSPSTSPQELSETLGFYHGDFLEGFSLEKPAQFDDWVMSERERYRLAMIRGCTKFAHQLEEQQEYSGALDSLRRALAFNPFQEDLQREVMRLLYLNGDRTGVVRQYESLRKLLDEEMGMLPMKETRNLYDAIIQDGYTSASFASTPASASLRPQKAENGLPFLGREAELKTLASFLGQGKLILLEGEAGIGKTRLFAELVATRSHQDGPDLVIQGTAYELEQGLPYQPILDGLRKLRNQPDWKPIERELNLPPVWLSELSRLLPEFLEDYPQIQPPHSDANETRLWEALLQFFKALSERLKIWLFVDDLHWADAATIAWLGYFVRHLAAPALTVITASRPIEGAPADLRRLLQMLKREERLVHLQLSGLSDSTMQKMAAKLSPERETELSSWLIGNAEGNPFFLAELVRYARGTGLLKGDGSLDGALFESTPIIPVTIQNLIESRLLLLSEPARGMIHLAGVIGREFDLELVRHATDLSEDQLLNAIEELQAAHLVRLVQNEQFAFDHSLTMQVALQDMSQARRHSLHRQVAGALEGMYRESLDSIAGLLARHYQDGNAPAQAVTYAFRAGQLAANLAAWVEAIAFYEMARDLETDQSNRVRIFLTLGAARFHKGDFARASADYRTAADLAQAQRDWPLLEAAHLALNQSFMPQARFAEAVELARELRRSGPPELAATAEFCWGTGLGIESAHPAEAEIHLREADRMVRERGEESTMVTLAQIHYQLAGVVGQLGRSQEAIDLYRDVLAKIEEGRATLDILRNIMLYNNLAYHLHLLGDPAASKYIEAGFKLAREKGSLTHLTYLYSTSGEIALDENRLEEAENLFREGLAIAEQIPMPERIAGMTANLGLVARQRGEPSRATKLLNEALHLARKVGSRHLEVRIGIWLAPLLSMEERRNCLSAACTIAEKEGLQGLLEEIRGLERDLLTPS